MLKPLFSKTDFSKLTDLSSRYANTPSGREAMLLAHELRKGKVVADDEMPENVIRLFSFIEVRDVKAHSVIKLQIVPPEMADIKEKKISILAPISIALIGFREGEEIEWILPAERKRLTITSVINKEISVI